jgi:hypothetical protein
MPESCENSLNQFLAKAVFFNKSWADSLLEIESNMSGVFGVYSGSNLFYNSSLETTKGGFFQWRG